MFENFLYTVELSFFNFVSKSFDVEKLKEKEYRGEKEK